MPRKSDSIPINNKKLDRRYKLTDEQRKEIFKNKAGLSQRKLAKLYGVSRRLITFVLFPEKYEINRQQVKARGTKKYYNKEKHAQQIKEHRNYKKELFNKNLIGKNSNNEEKQA